MIKAVEKKGFVGCYSAFDHIGNVVERCKRSKDSGVEIADNKRLKSSVLAAPFTLKE